MIPKRFISQWGSLPGVPHGNRSCAIGLISLILCKVIMRWWSDVWSHNFVVKQKVQPKVTTHRPSILAMKEFSSCPWKPRQWWSDPGNFSHSYGTSPAVFLCKSSKNWRNLPDRKLPSFAIAGISHPSIHPHFCWCQPSLIIINSNKSHEWKGWTWGIFMG